MRISIIGCGYVGLVTGGCLADIGHDVTCADSDPERIATLKAGRLPIHEPHLDTVVATARGAGRLAFTRDAGEAVRSSDSIFICVGTPPRQTGEVDLSAIDNVARMIATEARTPKLVIEKSTVPAQTGLQLKRALAVYGRKHGLAGVGVDFGLLKEAERVNRHRVELFLDKVRRALWVVRASRLACSASPSSPIPTTSAWRRPSKSSSGS